jgi:hypothetical protein
MSPREATVTPIAKTGRKPDLSSMHLPERQPISKTRAALTLPYKTVCYDMAFMIILLK